MAVSIPNVKPISGRLYYCRKIKGKQRYVRLPDVTDAKFPAALAKARRKLGMDDRKESVREGSFNQLIAEYRASSDYQGNLSAATRANYDRYLDQIGDRMGDNLVSDLRASIVEKLRDKMSDKPGKANNWLNVLTTILDFGVRRDYIQVNPAEAVSRLKIGEHQPWPAAVLSAAMEHANPMLRLAIQTGLYSGQRISDCIRITHKMMEGETVHLVQHKKRSKGDREIEVFIPIHPDWRQAAKAVEPRAATLLYDRSGKPFRTPEALQIRIRDLMKSLGFVNAKGEALYTFHGLRKNSSNYLAEMGLTPHEIGAINGMSAETVAHYTKGVSKRRLAESSRGRMETSSPLAGLRDQKNGVTPSSAEDQFMLVNQ